MDKERYLNDLRSEWDQCTRCALCETRNNVVFGYGNPDADILIIAEAPGQAENAKGVPLVGPSGALLDQYLGSVSASPEIIKLAESGGGKPLREALLEDVYITNVVACRPPDNRDPLPQEILDCSLRLRKIIYTVDPVVIITMGKVATSAIMKKSLMITKVRGRLLELEFKGKILPLKYPVIPILHTSYLLRINDFAQAGGMSDQTFKDILRAFEIVDKVRWLHEGTPITKRTG